MEFAHEVGERVPDRLEEPTPILSAHGAKAPGCGQVTYDVTGQVVLTRFRCRLRHLFAERRADCERREIRPLPEGRRHREPEARIAFDRKNFAVALVNSYSSSILWLSVYSFSFSAIDRVWLNLYERALSGNEQIPFETFVREFIQCRTFLRVLY